MTDGRESGPGFVVLWTLAGALAYGVGGPLGAALGSSGGLIVAGYMGVVLSGLSVGLMQWLMLRRHLERGAWWVAANLVALALVGAVVFGIGLIHPDVGWVVGVLAFGPLVGGLQWLVLVRQIPGSGSWVLVSAVAWIVGLPVGGALLGWSGIGTAYAAITGCAMVRLLRRLSTL